MRASSSKRSSDGGGSGRLLVVSPHCDDAVLACAGLLSRSPGAVVVTVFARGPAPGRSPLTPWDAAAGFRPDDDVMALRRAEDRLALRLLGARPAWLDFADAQYGPEPPLAAVAGALEAEIDAAGATTVIVPLGLFHSDHRLVHSVAMAVLGRRPGLEWLAYEDALYRAVPRLLDERVAGLEADGLHPLRLPAVDPPDHRQKRRAVEAYASQLRALNAPGMPGVRDAFSPERCWRLRP